MVGSRQLQKGRGVVWSAFEVWFAFYVKPEDALFPQLCGVSLKGLRVFGDFYGTMETDEGELVDRLLIKSFGNFLLSTTRL